MLIGLLKVAQSSGYLISPPKAFSCAECCGEHGCKTLRTSEMAIEGKLEATGRNGEEKLVKVIETEIHLRCTERLFTRHGQLR